jgi:hypothetical protein
MPRIDWLTVLFGIAFSFWLAADSYTGFYVGFALPVSLGKIGLLLCVLGLIAIGIRDWRAAALSVGLGALLLALADRLWKYAIHPTAAFKLIAVALLMATPLIVGLGVLVLWRNWQRLQKARPVVSH